MTTKTITLCDGFKVTFKRRGWAEYNQSLQDYSDALLAIEKSDLPLAQKNMEASRLGVGFREKPMELYVENWPEVKPRLSMAGFNQLERELQAFSESELVEGN